jgi:hypothetical protein
MDKQEQQINDFIAARKFADLITFCEEIELDVCNLIL